MGLTDIETKRDSIIEAALQCERVWRSHSGDVAKGRVKADLVVAVREYNAALKPDPWQLLDRVGDSGARFDGVLFGDIKAALAWRKENP